MIQKNSIHDRSVPKKNVDIKCIILNGPLQLGLLARPCHRALDQTVRVGLRNVHFSVLAGVLESFVPAQVYNGKRQ